MNMESQIRDINLAHSGELKIEWDYCLPNVFLSGDELGFLDLGSAGIMDKDYDVFMCLWSMRYNFVTLGGMDEERFEKCKRIFFDALGEPENEEKLRFHGLLDEFFV